MEPFDKEGDFLIRSINVSQIEPSEVHRHISKKQLISHPSFLHSTYLISALSTKGGEIPFEGTPTHFTTDVNDEDTIVFIGIRRIDNGKLMDRAVILTKNIISIRPINNDWTKFETNDRTNLTSRDPNSEGSVDLFGSSQQVFDEIDQTSFIDPQQGESLDILSQSYQIPNRQTPSPTQSQLQTDFSIISPLRTSTMNHSERHLPLLASGKVDLFMLSELHKLDAAQTPISFAQWRRQLGFDLKIQKDNLQFGTPMAFDRDPDSTETKQKFSKWQASFASHQLSFDDWTLLNSLIPFKSTTTVDPTPPMPKSKLCESCGYCTCLNHEKCTCCACIDAQADRLLSKIQPMSKIEEVEEYSRHDSQESLPQDLSTPNPPQDSLSLDTDIKEKRPDENETTIYNPWKMVYPIFMQKLHDKICQEWLTKTEPSRDSEIVVEQWHKQGGWLGTERSFYHFLSEMQPWTPIPKGGPDASEQSEITMPKLDTFAFSQKEIAMLYDTAGQNCSRLFRYIKIDPKDFLPNGSLSTVYIPTYCYIPDACVAHLKLQIYKLSTFARMILWHKLYHARQQAQLLVTEEHLQDIPVNDWTKHLLSVMKVNSVSDTHLIDLIQHSEALKMNKTFDLTPIAVYDTLFRPMERLCGIDMPLHDTFMQARFDMSARNELYGKMVALIDFDLTVKLNSHSLFKYLSFVRHLSYQNLSPSHRFGVGPLYHIQSLDPLEDDPSEKPIPSSLIARLQTKVVRQLCEESPIAEPFIHVPLEKGYLKEFPELGGINMSMKAQRLLANIHNEVVANEPKATNDPKLQLYQQPPPQRLSQPPPPQQQQQQQQPQRDDKTLLIMCDFINDERNATQENDWNESEKDQSPRSYSETIKLRPQVIQAPPVPIRPQPTADLEVFPFLRKI